MQIEASFVDNLEDCNNFKSTFISTDLSWETKWLKTVPYDRIRFNTNPCNNSSNDKQTHHPTFHNSYSISRRMISNNSNIIYCIYMYFTTNPNLKPNTNRLNRAASCPYLTLELRMVLLLWLLILNWYCDHFGEKSRRRHYLKFGTWLNDWVGLQLSLAALARKQQKIDYLCKQPHISISPDTLACATIFDHLIVKFL